MNAKQVLEIERVKGSVFSMADDFVAVEEPLEIRLSYGAVDERRVKSIAVTMRTPGNDAELAAGFLWTEGVIEDSDAIAEIVSESSIPTEAEQERNERTILPHLKTGNTLVVRLHPDAAVRLANLERNFYTTSSCGVCGKASLSALKTLSPPRHFDEFEMDTATLSALPAKLRALQPIFESTGGIHGAAIVDGEGNVELVREDVGRHNAVDKLIGHGLLAGKFPYRNRCLLLSGRASFELMQKAVMAGIPFVAAVGAPSSLAVEVAKRFELTLVGFLRDGSFNVYSGFRRTATGIRS